MPPWICQLVLAAAIGSCALPATAQLTPDDSLELALIRAAPAADPEVIHLALAALSCASAQGEPAARHLTVIDYSLPSTQARLWVFDLSERRALYTELVAHGRNSGDNHARSFSNIEGSFETSLGLFRTQASYVGKNGYSMRMHGLEAGFNDRAAERAIVMHGAPYVSKGFARIKGRLGRSHGCPAVRPEIAQPLIDTIKNGQYLFAYYPDPKWLAASTYLRCARGKTRLPNTVTASAASAMR